MPAIFYSLSSRGFYRADVHSAIPVDAVEITSNEHKALLAALASGERIVLGDDGHLVVVAPEAVSAVLTHDQVDALRRKAYADVQTGSDRLYIDYQRCLAVGDAEGAEVARQAWLDRAVEIQAQYPWPEVA